VNQDIVVDVPEIRAIRWECPNCRTSFDFPIQNLQMFASLFTRSTWECRICSKTVGSAHDQATVAVKAVHDAFFKLLETNAPFKIVLAPKTLDPLSNTASGKP
jgi:ribosomal protein L37AE/L43A